MLGKQCLDMKASELQQPLCSHMHDTVNSLCDITHFLSHFLHAMYLVHRPDNLMHQITKWCCLQGMQDAYVTITLVDSKGNVMGRPQDTPTSNNLAGNYVLFNCEVSSPPPLAPRLGNSPLLHAVFSYAAMLNGTVAAPTLLH